MAQTPSIANDVSAASNAHMRTLLGKIQRAFLNRLYNTGAVAISATKTLAKIANTVYYTVDGNMVKKTTANFAVLAGTVVNATFNVFALMGDASGTLTTAMGTAGATLADVVFPTVPITKTLLGFIIINPTGTGNFVGATTDLDDATVVPNAVYVDTVGIAPSLPDMVSL